MMKNKLFVVLLPWLGLLWLTACGSAAMPTPIAAVTTTPAATNTPQPTDALKPSPTPKSTQTPVPTNTNTPQPSSTPEPQTEAASATESTAVETTSALPDSSLAAFDGLALIQAAEENSHNQETLTMEQIVVVSATGFSQSTNQTCVSDIPAEATFCETLTTVNIIGTQPVTSSIQLVQIGADAWLREESGRWEPFPVETMENLNTKDIAQLRLSDYMLETQVVRRVTIDELETYQIDFALDVDRYFAFILGEEAAAQFAALSSDSYGSGSIWIAIATPLPIRVSATMGFTIEGEELLTEVKANYHSYNQPIEIPDPTADSE